MLKKTSVIFIFIIVSLFLLSDFFNLKGRYLKYQKDVIVFIDQNIFKTKILESSKKKISLILIGHAFGEMKDDNLSINQKLNNFLLSKFKNDKNIFFFLGDFIKQGKIKNWKNFDNYMQQFPSNKFYIMGNHEDSQLSYLKFFLNSQSSYFLIEYNDNAIFILNTVKNLYDISYDQIEFIKKKLSLKKYKQIFLLSHHLIWLDRNKMDDNLVNNGSSFQNIKENNMYKKNLLPLLKKQNDSDIYFISGDMGRKSSYFEYLDKNIKFYAIGYGSNSLSKKSEGGTILKINFENKIFTGVTKIDIN
jgi:calcineurin-like phosphoesterase family protein